MDVAAPSPTGPTTSFELEWVEVPVKTAKERRKASLVPFFDLAVQEIPRIVRPVFEGPIGYVEMGSIIGIARPGYAEQDDISTKCKKEIREIEETLTYLKRKNVVLLVSLSNVERHDSHDMYIEERWKAINEDRLVFFEHIPNEDVVDYRGGRFPRGAGPSVDKFKTFADLVNRFAVGDSKVALYCGAGKGRSCSYLASHLVLRCNLAPVDAVGLVIKGMDRLDVGEESSTRYEIERNFGEISLEELAEEVALMRTASPDKK